MYIEAKIIRNDSELAHTFLRQSHASFHLFSLLISIRISFQISDCSSLNSRAKSVSKTMWKKLK